MPKLVVDAGGDEFFQPDDNWLWWDDMSGELHLLMLQDAEHSLATAIPEVIKSVSAFALAVMSDRPRPTLTWTMQRSNTSGTTVATCSEQPVEVRVWHADTLNASRRDWRLIKGMPCEAPCIPVKGECLQPILWYESAPVTINNTTFSATFEIPKKGWRAFFMQFKFKGVGIHDFVFSTQVCPCTFLSTVAVHASLQTR